MAVTNPTTNPTANPPVASPTTSGPHFATIGEQIAYWLSHITQYFKGGYSGSGENGVDVALPLDTPVYALTSGTVKGEGYYGGGGVVSIEQSPGTVWYYQHLDQIVVGRGQVNAGDLIGYSGGQLSGGSHPTTSQYSNGPHIEVGINAPWGGIWGGGEGPNVNPLPYLQGLTAATLSTKTSSTPGGSGVGDSNGPPPGGSPFDALGGLANFFNTIGSAGSALDWISKPLRIGKGVAGLVLIIVAIVLIFRAPIKQAAVTAAKASAAP